MDWADRTEERGNAGKTASSFFHPSDPSEFGYLIQRKSLILQSKLARGAGRTPFHPVNPGRHKPTIVANRLILLSPRRQAGAGQNHRIGNLLSRRNGAALTAPVILNIKFSK